MSNKAIATSHEIRARCATLPRSSDEEIIRANVASILAEPNKLYDHQRGKLDAVAIIEVAIRERLQTIRHYRPICGRRLSASSRDYVAALRCEAGMMEEAVRRLRALGITTTSPLALQLQRERENPLPSMRELLMPAAKLHYTGKLRKQAAMLLDTKSLLPGVDAGKIRPELIEIAVVTKLGKGPLNLSLTAGWGHAGKGDVTMPGKGKLLTTTLSIGPDYKLPWFEFHDVYLNEFACWKDIPTPVWDYTIGGYQVIKKWLSYREFELLGRALTPDEAREVTHMARRIAALILLEWDLDKNYQAVKSASAAWSDFATGSK
jgi:hypothetical protein